MRGGRCRYYSEAAVEDVSAPKHYYLLHPHTTSMTHEFRFKPISTFPVWLKNKQKNNNNVVLKLMMTHIYLYLRHYFKFLLESSSQQHTTQTRIQELKIIRLKILSFSASPRPPLVLPFSSKQCSDFCWFFKSKGSITNWLENEDIWSNITTTSNSSWAWPLHIQFLHLIFVSVSHYIIVPWWWWRWQPRRWRRRSYLLLLFSVWTKNPPPTTTLLLLLCQCFCIYYRYYYYLFLSLSLSLASSIQNDFQSKLSTKTTFSLRLVPIFNDTY